MELLGKIDWSWWWVLASIWIPTVILLVILLVILIIALVYKLFE